MKKRSKWSEFSGINSISRYFFIEYSRKEGIVNEHIALA